MPLLAPTRGDFAVKKYESYRRYRSARVGEPGRTAARRAEHCCCVAPVVNPTQLLRQSDFLQFLGEENMLPHVEAALSRAREIHEGRAADRGTQMPRVDGAVSRA